MYQASAPIFLRQLATLSAVLRKGADFTLDGPITAAVLVQARLAPDMATLTRQVQIATDSVKSAMARLSGTDIPSYADTETTFDDLQARIAKTVAFMEGFDPAQIDGSEERVIVLKVGAEEVTLNGQAFLLHFAIPNFLFHVTTAYGILRHNGVVIGKRDYLGR